MRRITLLSTLCLLTVGLPSAPAFAQANPLWTQHKVRNYLPDMTWPEVEALLRRTDVVIIPLTAIEEHGREGPLGTDYLNGVERAKLIAQKTDVLVAPILLPGNSPYHMDFPGTITLKPETIQQVYFEAIQSLIHHGFRRFLLLNSHGGNTAIAKFIADRVNQETPGTALDLGEASGLMKPKSPVGAAPPAPPAPFDRHAGVRETSDSLYLTPGLVDLRGAKAAPLTMPDHLAAMIPAIRAGDKAAELIFLAEALKARSTGKKSSTREMTATGNWTEGDLATASAEQGRISTDEFVRSSVAFIEKWKALEPNGASPK